MTLVVGFFEGSSTVAAACGLLDDAGLTEHVTVLSVPADDVRLSRLLHRGEAMLRAGVKWGLLGSVIVEGPSVLALLVLPIDRNVKVLLAATVWKFGAAFGAWIGAMSAGEHGLDEELAAEYEQHLSLGRSLPIVDVPSRRRPMIRGLLLESGALSIRDVRGTFANKSLPTPTLLGVS